MKDKDPAREINANLQSNDSFGDRLTVRARHWPAGFTFDRSRAQHEPEGTPFNKDRWLALLFTHISFWT